MEQSEPAVLADADLVFYTAEALAQPRARATRHLCYLPNGMPAKLFLTGVQPRRNRTGSATARIGYLGNWYPFMATDLLFALCRDHPQWDFIFAGPVKTPAVTAHLRRLPNVTFRGPLPYSEIPAFLHGLDVALIPFLLNEYVRATNPLKTYEYMAAGVPIVASDLPELRRFAEIIHIVENTPQAFAAAIAEFLHQDREKLSEHMRAVAHDYTWEAICRRVIVPELLRMAGD
jgi:glycosyltransferase involved in cell wall biosynthesis